MKNINSNRAEEMRAHIERCQSSGMKVTDYCKANNLTDSNYYYWVKKLKAPVLSGEFIPLSIPSAQGVIKITFPNTTQLQFDNLIPVNYLKELLCCI